MDGWVGPQAHHLSMSLCSHSSQKEGKMKIMFFFLFLFPVHGLWKSLPPLSPLFCFLSFSLSRSPLWNLCVLEASISERIVRTRKNNWTQNMSSQGIGIFAGLVAGFHSSFDLSTLFSYSFLSLCKSQCKVYHCITPSENPSNPFVAKQWQKYQILQQSSWKMEIYQKFYKNVYQTRTIITSTE